MIKKDHSILSRIFRGEQIALLLALFIVAAIGAVTSDSFLTQLNITNILRQVSLTAIAGIGMVLIILTGNIDLSVGSTQAAVGIAVATVVNATESIFAALLAAILVGIVIGSFNGFLVTVLKLNSLIATLATMAIVRGTGLIITQAVTIPIHVPAFIGVGAGMLGPIPVPVLICVALIAICYFVLNHTVFGRHIYALGGNREAAKLAGLPIRRIEFTVFVLGNILFAISAFILTSRLNAGQAIAGTGFEMIVIAAVILGGVSLVGGTGSLVSALIGILILQLIQNILVLNNVMTFYHDVVRGFVIILAVYLDVRRKRSADKVRAEKSVK